MSDVMYNFTVYWAILWNRTKILLCVYRQQDILQVTEAKTKHIKPIYTTNIPRSSKNTGIDAYDYASFQYCVKFKTFTVAYSTESYTNTTMCQMKTVVTDPKECPDLQHSWWCNNSTHHSSAVSNVKL